MEPRSRLHNTTDLTGLQRKSILFKLLLHLVLPKEAQIPPLTRTAAVRLGDGKVSQSGLTRFDLLFIALDDLQSFVLGPGNICLSPALRPSTLIVLDQQMGSSDLAVGPTILTFDLGVGSAVMASHVRFEGLSIGSVWGIPA
jgi:hypothetical protein